MAGDADPPGQGPAPPSSEPASAPAQAAADQPGASAPPPPSGGVDELALADAGPPGAETPAPALAEAPPTHAYAHREAPLIVRRDEQPGDEAASRAVAVQVMVVLLCSTVAGIVLGGDVLGFLGAAFQFAPFALLALLAYMGQRQLWALVLAFAWQLMLVMSNAALVVGLVALAANAQSQAAGGPPMVVSAEVGMAFLWSAAGAAASLALLFPAVRRRVAAVLPISADSWTHALGLSIVGGTTIMCFGQLIATGGEPPILALIKADPRLAGEMLDKNIVGATMFGLVWAIPCCIAAAGFPTDRSLAAAFRRLGFVRPTLRQVGGALLLSVLMAGASWGLDHGVEWLWTTLHWPRTDQEAFSRLLKPLTTPVGAAVIGITAGVGEEMAVRGVLQPRLGIVLSNLFFTGMHALQYSFDGLLSVFLIGLALGYIRQRTNTSTSAIVHGTYDFILVMFSVITGE